MKKRVLSLILAVLMVLSVLPVMTLSIGAEEPEATPVAEFNYDDLYYQTGIIAWFRAEDVNGEQPGVDALGNKIYIVNPTYEADGSLKSGQVQYEKDFLDSLNGGAEDGRMTENASFQAVFGGSTTHSNDPILNMGVYSLVQRNAGLYSRIASWNVRTGTKNNTIGWDVYYNFPGTNVGNTLFSYTQALQFSFPAEGKGPYKYVYDSKAGQHTYQDADKRKLDLTLSSGTYYGVYGDALNGKMLGKYKKGDELVPVKQFNEETKQWYLTAPRHSALATFQTYINNNSLGGTAVDVADAKVLPAFEDDLPYDGYIRTNEYLNGTTKRLSHYNRAYNIPIAFGSHGDEVIEGVNTNETLWDGKEYSTLAAYNADAAAVVGDLRYGAANLYVGATTIKTYELRVYKGVLSDNDMRQNHFADLAKYKGLDKDALALFVKLDDAGKKEIYNLFKGYAFNGAETAEELNAILRPAVSKKYIALYDAQTGAEVAFKNLFIDTEVDVIDFFALDDFSKNIFLNKIASDVEAGTAEGTQVYFDGVIDALLDYSALDACPEYFKADFEAICLAATEQSEIDNAAAVYYGLDLSVLDVLSADKKAAVEAKMAEGEAALDVFVAEGDVEGAQAWLDAIVDAVVNAIYKDYDALYVKDGLYSHINFLETSKNELSGEDVVTWKNLIQGDVTDYSGANAILQRYVKLNTAAENYTLGDNGKYYETVNGNITLEAPDTDPVKYENGAISVIKGNTFQFGEGHIVSPAHSIGYYSEDGGANTTFFNAYYNNGHVAMSTGSDTSATQLMHTWLNLPDINTKSDHTFQFTLSFLNTTDLAASLVTDFNRQLGFRNSQPVEASFFGLYLPFWASGETSTSNISFPLQMGIREVQNGAWVATGANNLIYLPLSKNTYKIGDVQEKPVTYTMVSHVVTNTISEGDQLYVDSQSSYAAKADVKFYYNGNVFGSETFGTRHGDDLFWVAGGDPCSDGDRIGNRGGVAIYAIRMYNRTLSEAEINQNRFADIATFYHLDLKNYYLMDEDDRADAIKAFLDSLTKGDFAYAIDAGTSGKTRTSSEVVALYEKAFPAEKALTYLDFYSYDGLTSMITFYEATEADNTDTWKNMMASGEAYKDKGADAILQSYVKYGEKSDYTLNPYGMYYKTVGGNYVLYPSKDDPASATSYTGVYPADSTTVPLVLEGARGNTLEFHDGYILSPWHTMGHFSCDSYEDGAPTEFYAVGRYNNSYFKDFTVMGVDGEASQLTNTSMNLPEIDQTKDVTVQYVMSLHNRSTEEIFASYNEDAGLRGVDAINNAFFTLQTGSWYNNASKYEMQYTFKVRHDKGTGTWPNDTGNNLNTTHSLATLKYPTTFKQNEEHVPGTAATFTLWSDVFSTEIPEADQAVSGNNKYVAKAHVKLYYNNTVMADDSYFDTLHGGEETWIGAVAANLGESNVGIRGGAAIYAIRTYDRAITEEEMIQNQFADVVGYFHVDPSAMAQIPESAWAQVYPIFKDIKLTDTTITKASLESTLNEKVKEIKATIKTDLIIFEGYQARYADYNGLRALYTVNEELLAELEAEGFSVEFGAIYAKGAEKAIEGEVIDGEFTVDGAEVKTVYRNGMYIGEYFINKDTDEKQFTYTVKFEGEDATKANFEEKAQFIAYAVISDGETSEIEYFASDSKLFEDAVSLRDVAKKYYDNGNGYYRVIQDVLGACGDLEGITGKAYEINGANLGDYTIVAAPEAMKFALDLKAAIKAKNGYEILITDKAVSEGPSIKVGYAAVEDGVWAVEFNKSDVSLTGHGIEELKAAIDAFLKSFPESATDGVYVIPTDKIAP